MTTEKPGIEISSADLIKRPNAVTPGTPPGGVNLGNWVSKAKEIQGQLKQAQEIINQFRTLSGGKLDTMFPFLAKMGNEPGENPLAGAAPPGPSQANQLLMLARLVEMKYGDVTINQLIESLKAEYGNKRISQITRMK